MNFFALPITVMVEISTALVQREVRYLVQYKRYLETLTEKVDDLGRIREDVERLVQTAQRRGDLINPVVEAWLAKADKVRDEAIELNEESKEIHSWFKGWCCVRHDLGKEADKLICIINDLFNEMKHFRYPVSFPPKIQEFVSEELAVSSQQATIMNVQANSLIIEDVQISISLIEPHVRYLVHHKRNLQDLLLKVDDLGRMRDEIERLVQAARRRGDLITQVVQKWLEKVDKVRDEVIELNAEAEEINSWFKGWCCARHDVGKEAEKMIGVVNDLLNEGQHFRDPVSFPSVPPKIQSIPSTGYFLEFESRESVRNRIIEALKDEKIKVVGVYGMAGIGKTVLIEQIGKQYLQRDGDVLFDEVLMVIVSHKPVLKNIQGEIAERLGMKFEDDQSESTRAQRLWMRLKDERRILIILDDLWKRLDLAAVGIPYGDDNKGCKVVLTTRNLNVCDHMDANAVIQVNVLSKQDSMTLFRQVVGATVESPTLDKFAVGVVNECGGLPLAIVTVGRALRNKDQLVWEDASRQLRHSMFHDMENIISAIRLSYEYLVRKETRRCFLFCCLFPEDFKFTKDELLLYVIGGKLVRGVATLEEARKRLHRMLDILVSSCLLLKDDEDEKVMMHKVVRGAAISIAHEESNGFIVKAGMGLRQWPDAENLSRCMHMSLIKNDISKFPNQPECPQLLTLLLSRSYSFERLPNSFFERMTSLVTLDLKRTDISSLPPSLLCLVNLRTLLLDQTSLSDVSLVGELKELEILSLSDNKIERLPEEIGQLTNLRLLDLSKNHFLKIIPLNLLSSLSCLEELYMMGSFDGWEIDGIGEDCKARLTELASLKYLTILDLDISDVRCLSEEISINLRNLTKFRICGSGRGSEWKPKFPRAMSLIITSNPLSNWVKVLLKKTEELDIYSCKGLKNIVQLDRGRFNNLKFLRIGQCLGMRYLMSVVEETSEAAFSRLEVLDIWSMDSLEAIYHGPLPNGFLVKLKLLSLRDCNKITNVLTFDLLARMQNLEKLEVETCDGLKEVFDSEELEEGHTLIPSLKELYLYNLPRLTNIWKGMWKIIQSGVGDEEEDEIMEEEVLETIRQSRSYYISSSFPSPPIFPNLKGLEISSCHMLTYLFPVKIVRGLLQLQVLKVKYCEQIEEIIVGEQGEEDKEEDKMILPQLMVLELVYLPNLSSVYQRGLNFDWPSLEELCVEECPSLNRLPLGPNSAPQLKKIEGDNFEWFDWEDPSVKARLQPLFNQRHSP